MVVVVVVGVVILEMVLRTVGRGVVFFLLDGFNLEGEKEQAVQAGGGQVLTHQ